MNYPTEESFPHQLERIYGIQSTESVPEPSPEQEVGFVNILIASLEEKWKNFQTRRLLNVTTQYNNLSRKTASLEKQLHHPNFLKRGLSYLKFLFVMTRLELVDDKKERLTRRRS